MSAARDNRAWLQDMLTSMNHIETYTAGLDFDQFVEAPQVQHAVLFNFQIIGEAANRLEASFRSAHPSVPWSLMIGMRNVIVHGYFDVNLQIIWKTITEELPRLRPLLTAILADIEGQDS
jgi:uncharacterized protein with HEPN domain